MLIRSGFRSRSCALLAGLGLALGCSQPLRSRYVDTPTGKSFAYGAPRNTAYEVEAQPEHENVALYVYERSQCDKIPVDIVSRSEELVRGDDVVEVKPMGKVQIAKPAEQTVTCAASYARDLDVSLIVGGATYDVGVTDSHGYLHVNLARLLERGARTEALPDSAEIRVRAPRGGRAENIGKLELKQLKSHEVEVTQLLEEFNRTLDKGSALGPEDIRRSYVLYEQIRRLSYNDPRFQGAATRFWETVQGRKLDESSARLSQNLKALGQAQELLKSAGIAAIPLYAQIAASSGAVDGRSVEWAKWQLFGTLRTNPGACTPGFGWAELDGGGFPLGSAFAAQYLRFSQGDGFSLIVAGMCNQLAALR